MNLSPPVTAIWTPSCERTANFADEEADICVTKKVKHFSVFLSIFLSLIPMLSIFIHHCHATRLNIKSQAAFSFYLFGHTNTYSLFAWVQHNALYLLHYLLILLSNSLIIVCFLIFMTQRSLKPSFLPS